VVALCIGAFGLALLDIRDSPQSKVFASTGRHNPDSLSFLPVYRRVYDTGILTLLLAWLFESDHRQHTVKRTAVALFLLLLLPVQSVAISSQSYLSPLAFHSWWWNSMIAPYTAWTLLAFSAVLLYALVQPARTPERFD
jgi:hypothetical protein